MRRALCLSLVFLAAPTLAVADEAPSVQWGAHIAKIGGCHDCHTPGYAESGGKLDPKAALVGQSVGFQGPWGTTYPANLRLMAGDKSEDQWLQYTKNLKTRPPMPWYDVNELTERDLRSLYQYIKSLGEPGKAAPEYVTPDKVPTTPFIVFAPPQMPNR